jgi:hypothetical protein
MAFPTVRHLGDLPPRSVPVVVVDIDFAEIAAEALAKAFVAKSLIRGPPLSDKRCNEESWQ